MTNKINGIDVSESVLTATNNDVYYSQNAVDELQNNIKRLQEENEKLKKKKDEYYLINLDYETKISYLIQALEEINILAKNYCNACDEFKVKTYKALEEIRVFSENFCEDKCPFYENEYSEVCNEACLLDNIVNPILKKIDGVLNDRD